MAARFRARPAGLPSSNRLIETALATLALTGLAAHGVYYPNSPLFGSVIGSGPRSGRHVYLTFDDGPNLRATPSILSTLSDREAPAAFFMVGEFVLRYPQIARDAAALGHEIGNHTFSHLKLHRRGPTRIRSELERTHAAIEQATGHRPRTFRAPHGFRNPFVAPAARRLRYATFGWTFGVFDSARPGAEEIRRRVRQRLRSGAVILLHDGDGYDPNGDRTQTAQALSGIIDDVRAAGYELRPITDLLQQ
jgi:peptidoglycan/xylan/chitin deacetylase (PgdA/CDA1 family)